MRTNVRGGHLMWARMSGPVKNRVGTNVHGNECPGFGQNMLKIHNLYFNRQQFQYFNQWQCTVPQNFKLRPMRSICFDLVKACEGVFLLCFLGQIVTWQYNLNLLDQNWPCTVINDHDWQLRYGPLIVVSISSRVNMMSKYCYLLYLGINLVIYINVHIPFFT